MAEEIRHLNEVQHMCHRPKMYTANGTPEEILLVLQGLHMATFHYHEIDCRYCQTYQTPTDKLVEHYFGPTRRHQSTMFYAHLILEKIKEEGYTTDEEIFNRIMELTDDS